ncbi:MAG: ABC transporter permease [Microbacterium sp.]|uniref:ABC transporter permease n=1 Tax=Microbacterium sp. TaxID=51671 RepID=UPI001AD2A4AA|nr:ABC transporter permease [Microbacterium sp.]MBN9154666.1 ABC transporter permease [Microbacterium sp.]MBN9182832.1 ABC transporter permease [Microbacterium sp.]MBN9195121.1 ABC transporter permease [Microbacterium sp.]
MTWVLPVLKRVGALLIVFVGVTFLIYALVFALPGDPIKALGGDRPLPDSVVAVLRAKYHLDQPLIVQYLEWVGGLFRGDLGLDFHGRPVADQLAARWPVTFTLALTAWVIELILGLGLGLIAAIRRGTAVDQGILTVTILIGAIPVFVVGSTAQLVFGVRLGWFPVAGTTQGWPTAYILPALVIAIFGLGAVARLMRNASVDALGSDFVRLVRAKGVGEGRVIGVHVVRNSLIPAATYLATDLGYLLGGAVIIEGIFNMPGIGNLLFNAIRAHEGPTVVGVSSLLILVFLILSLLVDLLHVALDPRLRRV